MTFIWIALLSALATAGARMRGEEKKTSGAWIGSLLRCGLVLPPVVLALFRLTGGRIFAPHDAWDYGVFLLLCLGCGAAGVLARRLTRRQPAPAPGEGRRSRKATAGLVLSTVLVFLGTLAVLATNWAKAEYGDLPADQVLITYLSPTVGSDMVDYGSFLEGPLMLSLAAAAIFGLLAFSDCRFLRHRGAGSGCVLGQRGRQAVCFVLAGAVFLGGIGYGVIRFHLVGIYNAYLSRSSFLEDHYQDPRQAGLQFPDRKRNLIHIYLESMENSYMSREEGGFMEENLIPELTQIAREGYSFSHRAQGFGGPQAAVGTTWSVASMVNMSTGLPMKAPTENNAYGSPGNFLPGACTLGDILKEQGYTQTVMFGADADFGGLTYFFQTHGDFKIMDYKYVRDHGMIPEGYRVWWGYEDDKLLEFAKDELTRLSRTGKPFHFLMETADTHRPEGYLSKHAQRSHPNQYANVLVYNSQEVEKFIRWIQAQPFYENTTLVITGDHLSMESIFFDFYEFTDDYRRSQYNVILNPAPGTVPEGEDIFFNRDYANFDFFPTILTGLGVTYDGTRLGIGTDLFSGDKTLFEEYGFPYANRELEKKSLFYNQHILQ